MMQTATFEALGRLKKINALMAQIDKFCSWVGLHPNKDGYEIARMLRGWPAKRWAELSVSCGKRPPSETTIREILDLYNRRAA